MFWSEHSYLVYSTTYVGYLTWHRKSAFLCQCRKIYDAAARLQLLQLASKSNANYLSWTLILSLWQPLPAKAFRMRPCRPGPEKHNSLEISYDNHEYLTPEMLFQVLVKLKSFLTIPLQAITNCWISEIWFSFFCLGYFSRHLSECNCLHQWFWGQSAHWSYPILEQPSIQWTYYGSNEIFSLSK